MPTLYYLIKIHEHCFQKNPLFSEKISTVDALLLGGGGYVLSFWINSMVVVYSNVDAY